MPRSVAEAIARSRAGNGGCVTLLASTREEHESWWRELPGVATIVHKHSPTVSDFSWRGEWAVQLSLVPTGGQSWTAVRALADAIDASQGAGGGTVTLHTRDAEQWERWCTELVGICSEQRHGVASLHCEGEDRGEPRWRVRVELRD